MYSLHLSCSAGEVDLLSAELWELDTAGIRELDHGDTITLIAGFETNTQRDTLLRKFAPFSPEWKLEEVVDWVQWTHDSWPPRTVGEKLFLAPTWSNEPAPEGRLRLIHNPGLACGTGEHPCTQLALAALERLVKPACRVLDVGTGSGILAIAAKLLGAGLVVGADTDLAALASAHQNFALNQLKPLLCCGSADALATADFDVTIANISGSVLLSILDDLLRVAQTEGHLILTGFTESELPRFLNLFPGAEVSALNEWRCLAAHAQRENKTYNPAPIMTNDQTIDQLNRLIRVNKDAEAGLRTAAGHVKNSELESLFTGYAKQHAAFATQLESEVERLCGEPIDAHQADGPFARAWLDLKSALTGHSPAALLASCESGEESAEVAYYDTFDGIPSGQVHTLIAKQHEQIKAFKTRLCRLAEETKHGLEYPENE